VVDWKLAMEEERAALKRLVALLLALANLVDCASRRPALVRKFVFWILHHAEGVAWDFVVGESVPPAVMPGCGDSPAEAARLARSFRALARELDRQTRWFFAAQCGVPDNGGQARLARYGVGRTLAAADVLKAMQLVLGNALRRTLRATGPP